MGGSDNEKSGDEGRIDHDGQQGSGFFCREEENRGVNVGTGGQKPEERRGSRQRADTRRQDSGSNWRQRLQRSKPNQTKPDIVAVISIFQRRVPTVDQQLKPNEPEPKLHAVRRAPTRYHAAAQQSLRTVAATHVRPENGSSHPIIALINLAKQTPVQ